MSKKMTPCERLGYKVGDKFKASKSGAWFNVGEEVELGRDDGSNYPYFFNARMPKDSGGGWPRHIESVEKISNARLKPAKQALADAIHQSGGWKGGLFAIFGKLSGRCIFCENKPHFCRESNGWFVNADSVIGGFDMKPFVNWHQTCLSRDEYLTAYPEQVKVEICNETKHKVEVEMESESEMTIKVGDWHKNGELPPVGEVVMLNSTNPNDYRAHHVGAELTVVAHDKDSRGVGIAVYRFVDADGYSEYHGLVAHAFMPLRTERDKAIDEMVGEFINYYGDPKGGERHLGIAEKLYDAGYRKEVK